MRSIVSSLGVVCALWVLASGAQAQYAPRIWDLMLGTPIKDLPLNDYVDPACGTNGGPPARTLKGWDEFSLCPKETETGLHEVWFRYDDEMEYVARARRSEILVRQYQANALNGLPIVTSLLIDDKGTVQGYRVVNDARVDGRTRINAFGLGEIFKGMATALECVDLPAGEGERPIEDWFIKENCETKGPDGAITRVQTRRFYKPGQYAVDPNDARLNENEFESSARIEVFHPPAAVH
jgi:hypothetical protein